MNIKSFLLSCSFLFQICLSSNQSEIIRWENLPIPSSVHKPETRAFYRITILDDNKSNANPLYCLEQSTTSESQIYYLLKLNSYEKTSNGFNFDRNNMSFLFITTKKEHVKIEALSYLQ